MGCCSLSLENDIVIVFTFVFLYFSIYSCHFLIHFFVDNLFRNRFVRKFIRHANHQVCGRWRWRRWQDMSPNIVHNQQISIRICANCIWQLCSDGNDWRRALYAWIIRYGRSGRLRSIASAVISADGCISRLLLGGQSQFIRKCQGEGKSSI